MKTSPRLRPIWARSVSSSRPAAPTKGRPWTSSLNPGASPTIITSAGTGPLPGTAWVRLAWSPQTVHTRMRACKASSSRSVCGPSGDVGFGPEADQLAGAAHDLHHPLQVGRGEGRQGQAEAAGGEDEGVSGRLCGEWGGGGGD